MIRVTLPYHLRNMAKLEGEAVLEVSEPVTLRTVLDALEAAYPPLRGAIRHHVTKERRPFVRFFAEQQDLSHQPIDAPLPESVATGREALLIVGAIAGG